MLNTGDKQNPESPLISMRTRNSFITDRAGYYHRRVASHVIPDFGSRLGTTASTSNNNQHLLQESGMTSSSKGGADSSAIKMQKVNNWWTQKKNFGRGWIRDPDGKEGVP